MTEKLEENNLKMAENAEPTPQPIEKLQKKKYKYPYDADKNKEYKQRSKQKKLIETRVDQLVKNKLSRELPAPVKENMETPKTGKDEFITPQEFVTKEKYKKLKNKINNLENKVDSLPLPEQMPLKINPVYSFMFR